MSKPEQTNRHSDVLSKQHLWRHVYFFDLREAEEEVLCQGRSKSRDPLRNKIPPFPHAQSAYSTQSKKKRGANICFNAVKTNSCADFPICCPEHTIRLQVDAVNTNARINANTVGI
ncbi:hypothetical protein Bpfe_003082 [Biomphalaria pfeifferi]|uniref:Uncharacterized protein n=1 Tax=Biomphalaria pfeifferi TaxID=112525 RepID=A0AAD8C8Y9_BIOPF|nr:hypothetical protein Bpfe_003082 [Biomphalaria pfeifferi]